MGKSFLKKPCFADRILVVDNGKIVQQGKLEKLMREEGIYKQFVQSRELVVGWKL